MDVKTGLFYLFAVVLIFAAFRVITARNPVSAVLYLVLSFFQASAIWMLLEAEFLSITLVLVYVGAVMVLFLFVVMMLDEDVERLKTGFWKHFPAAAVVGVLVILELSIILLSNFTETQALPMRGMDGAPLPADASNTTELGKLLYTHYLYPLEIAAIILLVAMISAIALTLRKRKDSKAIPPSEQVHVRSADRVRIVKMEATRAAPAAEAATEENKA